MKANDIYGVRRFTDYRGDGRCFELYKIHTGECASFPATRKQLEIYAKKKNAEEKEGTP